MTKSAMAQAASRNPYRDHRSGFIGFLLMAPALGLLAILYLYPLVSSFIMSFISDAGIGFENYQKAISLYTVDILYTVIIAVLSLVIIFLLSVTLAGFLRFYNWPFLNFLYRLPLFIPFLIVGHSMRVFLAPHGIMNLVLTKMTGIPELPGLAFSWAGLVISFVWKQFPLATLLILGAFQSIDGSIMESALNLGTPRFKVIKDILLPVAKPSVLVAMILTFVSTMGCLTIPLLIGPSKPLMLPADMSFRVTYFNDWGVANALGVISYLIVMFFAFYYLQYMVKGDEK
jgi:putative spermidine/putrescine transport system permease protein